MSGYNKCILMGNLTSDPTVKYLKNQTAVVEFGLAANTSYTKKDGTKIDDSCFVDCQAFGPRAETISKYFEKGKPILIEGRLTYQQWEANGYKHSKHCITIDSFTFVPSPERAEREPEQAQSQQPF